MSKILGLINLKGTYKKVNDDEKEIYYNEESDNLIVFNPIDDENTEDVCNSISDENYNYLIRFLNNNKHVVVYWSKVEGTTSDYIIFENTRYFNLKGLDFEEVEDSLLDSIVGGEISYKYIVINNGIASKIEIK